MTTSRPLIPVVIPLIDDLGGEVGEVGEVESSKGEEEEVEEEEASSREQAGEGEDPACKTSITLFVEEPPPPPPPLAAVPYLQKMEETSTRLSSAIQRTSSSLTNALYERVERYKATNEPRDDPVEIPPAVQTVISKTQIVVGEISRVSSATVELVSELASVAASKVMKESDPAARPTVLSSVASKGMEESWKVWSALTAAGKQLLEATGDSLSEVVNHRYGWNAAQTAREGLLTSVDVFTTTQQTTCKTIGTLSASRTVSKVLSRKSQQVEIELQDLSPPLGDDDVLSLEDQPQQAEDTNIEGPSKVQTEGKDG